MTKFVNSVFHLCPTECLTHSRKLCDRKHVDFCLQPGYFQHWRSLFFIPIPKHQLSTLLLLLPSWCLFSKVLPLSCETGRTSSWNSWSLTGFKEWYKSLSVSAYCSSEQHLHVCRCHVLNLKNVSLIVHFRGVSLECSHLKEWCMR